MAVFSRLASALFLAASLAACDNAGVDLGFPEEQTNVIRATVYLDRDGSRTPTPLDTVYTGARVALVQPGTTDTLRSVVSDSRGIALFANVALGEYTVAVSPTGLGDSVLVSAMDTSLVIPSTNQPTIDLEIRLPDDTTDVLVRLSYPEVTLAQARSSEAGKRVFVRGIILAGVQSFRDETSHLSDPTAAIRLTGVTLRGGINGNPPGDSVSVLGLTSSLLGQPVLDQAIITRLGTRPAPNPQIVSSGTAATASNGTLDAALVQVLNLTISDTSTVSPDFRVVASDGTGSLTIILDANINFVRTNFRPGRGMIVRGVLVPDGTGAWNVKPRDLNDVALQ